MFVTILSLWFSYWHARLASSVYVPATPTDSTEATSLNLTETSQITMQWWSHGSYANHITTGSRRQGGTGISKGVLVHLSSDNFTSATEGTSTPWIAFISCDGGSGNTDDTDIFSLAQSKGAVAAVLYSLESETCILAPEFLTSYSTSSGIDIFVTPTSTAASLIEYQFGQLAVPRPLTEYDSGLLNELHADIVKSIQDEYPVSGGYLLTTLEAWNATEDAFTDNGGSQGGGNNATGDANGQQGSSATGQASHLVPWALFVLPLVLATLI